jgi:hypothetical protein
MDLYWNMGFNKKFIGYTIYTTVPANFFLVIVVLLIVIGKGKFEPTSSIAFLGPEIVFSNLYSKYLLDRQKKDTAGL